MELSLKIGVPMKKISDLKLSELMNEEGKYILYLSNTYSEFISGKLTYETGEYSWSFNYGGNVTVTQPVRNIGNVPIKGSEYNVEFTFYSRSGITSARKVMVESGVDLEPNEATTFILQPGEAWLSVCDAHDLSWNISFVYKNRTPILSLLKYVKFSGDEYDTYIAHLPEMDKIKEKIFEVYTAAFKRKLTEDDLAIFDKGMLRRLRNTFYANYGYIFKDKELAEYFNKFDWYKGTTTDMNEVSSKFNDIEKI